MKLTCLVYSACYLLITILVAHRAPSIPAFQLVAHPAHSGHGPPLAPPRGPRRGGGRGRGASPPRRGRAHPIPPPGGARPQGPPPALRLPAHQHHRVAGAGRQSVPVSLHDRVLAHLRRDPVRHVEEHRQDDALHVFGALPDGQAGAHGRRPPGAVLQAVAPPLLGGLRARPQGPVRRHPHPGAHYPIPHPLLRAHVASRVRLPGCDRGQHM